jgi:hypothetical protein
MELLRNRVVCHNPGPLLTRIEHAQRAASPQRGQSMGVPPRAVTSTGFEGIQEDSTFSRVHGSTSNLDELNAKTAPGNNPGDIIPSIITWRTAPWPLLKTERVQCLMGKERIADLSAWRSGRWPRIVCVHSTGRLQSANCEEGTP